MFIESLSVQNVRNISKTVIEPGQGVNFVSGPNAAGKTALLEAIHLLARSRSFRSPRIREVIQKKEKNLLVSARLKKNSEEVVSTGIEKTYGATTIKFDGALLNTVSEQARNVPVVLSTPDSHNLLTGSPKERRHWLDWAMFHVEQKYLDSWRSYQKALRNRNILLKRNTGMTELRGWEKAMCDSARHLDLVRGEFVDQLEKKIRDFTGLRPPGDYRVEFKEGGCSGMSLAEYLENERAEDFRLGYTAFGPHKADVHFLHEKELLSKTFSRGQLKRFVVMLQLAVALTFADRTGETPIFLVDDFTAELDTNSRQEMYEYLEAYKGQVFLTATEFDKNKRDMPGMARFHVEQGSFKKW